MRECRLQTEANDGEEAMDDEEAKDDKGSDDAAALSNFRICEETKEALRGRGITALFPIQVRQSAAHELHSSVSSWQRSS